MYWIELLEIQENMIYPYWCFARLVLHQSESLVADLTRRVPFTQTLLWLHLHTTGKYLYLESDTFSRQAIAILSFLGDPTYNSTRFTMGVTF